MPKAIEKTNAEFKAGIFIIITMIILVFCILWLRYFSVQPAMTVAAKFQRLGPTAKGLQVYYQGVSVGKISKIDFTDDHRDTLVHLQIFKKSLQLPSNVYAEIKTEGITGQKYIDLIYPKYPSSKLLSDGMVIRGRPQFSLVDLQHFLEKQVKSGKFERILDKTEKTLDLAYITSQRLDHMSRNADNILHENKEGISNLLKDSAKAASDLSSVTANINNFLGNPDTKGDLRSTIRAASQVSKAIKDIFGDKELGDNLRQTSKNITQITSNINCLLGDNEVKESLKTALGGICSLFRPQAATSNFQTGAAATPGAISPIENFGSLFTNLNKFILNLNGYTNKIYNDVQDTRLIENVSNTFAKASATIDKTNEIIEKSENTDDGKNLLTAITEAANNHGQAMKKFECVNCGLSDLLSQRFLLIKLLFGKPGSMFENCKDPNNCKLNRNLFKKGNITCP